MNGIPEFQRVRRIACIGEVMIELTDDGPDRAKLGVAGDTYNTAVYVARLLGDDWHVSYVTALGLDRLSERIIGHMQENGVGASFVERRPDRTPGLYAIETDDKGERSFSYWRSESAARTLFQAPAGVTLESLSSFDLVYLSGITLAILSTEIRDELFAFLRQFRAQGGLVAYDSNFRPHLWRDKATAQAVNNAMYASVDLALPSLDDEVALFGELEPKDVVRRLTEAGVKWGAVTCGANGLSPIPETTRIPPPQTAPRVVDTTAAGDSFNAGVIAALVQGRCLSRALAAGQDLAVKVLGVEGAIIPIGEAGD